MKTRTWALAGAAAVAGVFALAVCAGLLWGTAGIFTKIWGLIP